MSTERKDLSTLCDLVARLRAPDGCPWDREQTLASLRPHLLEEAHEAAAALEDGDPERIREELGDLLFQVAFALAIGRERGDDEPSLTVAEIEAKMIARHPHVFGDAVAETVADVEAAWERRKSAARPDAEGLLDGIPDTLPSLLEAHRLTRRAATVGFDWPRRAEVLAKVREELDELEAEMADGGDVERAAEELGDLLFACANLARHLGREPEGLMRAANRKFRRRLRAVETSLAESGRSLDDATLAEMESAWDAAKR